MQIAFTVSEDECYKRLPSMNINFTRVSFFSSFIFIAHFFVGLRELT